MTLRRLVAPRTIGAQAKVMKVMVTSALEAAFGSDSENEELVDEAMAMLK